MSIANDKNSIPVRYIGSNALLVSRVLTGGFQNVIQADALSFASGNNINRLTFVGEEAPTTNYDSIAKVGDEYIQVTFTSGVPVTSARYVFTAGGGWERYLTAGGSAGGVGGAYATYTGTSVKVIDARGIFSTAAGDNRIIYARGVYSGTTAQGESVRAYSQIKSTATSVHGIHATAEVSTGGSIVGQAVAGRFTAATITGLTLASTGSIYAVTAQTDLVSSVLNITDSAHVRIEDLNTYGMNNIISLGTIVGRSTDKAALGPYSYVSGKMTFAAAGVSAAIRVKTPDGTFYIPMYLQGDVS